MSEDSQETPASNSPRPPKILDLLGQDLLQQPPAAAELPDEQTAESAVADPEAPAAELPVNLKPESSAPPKSRLIPVPRPVAVPQPRVVSRPAPAQPSAVPESVKEPEKERLPVLAKILLVLVVGLAAAAIFYFRTDLAGWLKLRPEIKSWLSHAPSAEPATGSLTLKPRITVPIPPESAYAPADASATPKPVDALAPRSPADTNAEMAESEAPAGGRHKLIEDLESSQPMAVSTVALCRTVSGFGRYEEFPERAFSIEAVPLILVYAELAYCKPEFSDGRYVIRLSQQLSLLDEAGQKTIWKDQPAPLTDIALTRKHDFFVSQYLRLPTTTVAGKYQVQITLKDETSGATVSASTPLTIAEE